MSRRTRKQINAGFLGILLILFGVSLIGLAVYEMFYLGIKQVSNPSDVLEFYLGFFRAALSFPVFWVAFTACVLPGIYLIEKADSDIDQPHQKNSYFRGKNNS